MSRFTPARVLAALERRLAPPPLPPATGPVEVDSRHLTPAVADTVAAWFRGEIDAFELSGDRSVLVAHPEKPELRLKIKGAGMHGKPLEFSQRHRSGLVAPRFDFEGRMMVDVAAGHDNSYRGGASFQQAVVEYEVTQRLMSLGYDVVTCLGHGQVSREGRVSWFSVFELDPALRSITVPHFSVVRYAEQMQLFGSQMLELASSHRLIGYYWYLAHPAGGGPVLIRDVHPFYDADPVNMSRLSWVMQVLFAQHLVALPSLLIPALRDDPDRPPDAQVRVFRSFCPEAVPDDHEALRRELVGPYMRSVPKDFHPRTLQRVLEGNRITAALMERCPPQYAQL